MVAEATRNTKKMKPSQASIERWSGEVSGGRLPKGISMFFESSRASKRAPRKAQEVPVADPDTKTSKVSQFETFFAMVAEAI